MTARYLYWVTTHYASYVCYYTMGTNRGGRFYYVEGRSRTMLTLFCPLLTTYPPPCWHLRRNSFTEVRKNLYMIDISTATYLPRHVNVVCERPLVSLFGSRNDVPNLPKVLTFGSSNYPLPAGGSAAPRRRRHHRCSCANLWIVTLMPIFFANILLKCTCRGDEPWTDELGKILALSRKGTKTFVSSESCRHFSKRFFPRSLMGSQYTIQQKRISN